MNIPPNFLKLSSGLVGWWTFDGNKMYQNVADSSVSGNNGSLILGASGNTSTTTAPGKIGQALSFDGVDDYVKIPTAPTIVAPYTMSLWIYPRLLGTAQGLIDFGYPTSNTPYLYLHSNNQLVMEAETVVLVRAFSNKVFTASDLNKWWHIVVIVNSTTDPSLWKFYINGVDNGVEHSNNTGTYRTPSTSWALGAIYNNSQFFNGAMDDVRVYNYALSTTTIKQLYNMGAATKFSVSPVEPLKSGLVGYWTFDGNKMYQNVADSSASGNNGSLILGASGNTSTTTVPGKIGQALSFDGVDDWVNTSLTSDANFSNKTFSVALWFKTTTASVLISKEGGSNGWYIDANYNNFGNVTFTAKAGTDPQAIYRTGCTNNNANDGNWHHIVVVPTLDTTVQVNNTVSIYCDGVLSQGSISVQNVYGTTNNAVQLGRRGNCCNYYSGSLDDVRIYNRALSTTTIKQLYNMGAATKFSVSPVEPLKSGLVGYWTFDGNKMYQNVADSSVSGNNGSLIPGASGNTSTTTVPGKIGQALVFDGADDYINLGKPSSLNLPGALTICYWTYPLAYTVGDGDTSADFGNAAASLVMQYNMGVYNTGLLTLLWSDTVPNLYSLTSATGVVTLNSWQYLCAVRNSSTAGTLYKNGQALNTTVSGGTIATTLFGNSYIGDIADAPGSYKSNKIFDDVRVYNRALAPLEVQQLYNMGR